MKINIEITADNAAFEEPGELSRILQKLANYTEDISGRDGDILHGKPLMDYNGNRVGEVTVEE